MADLFKEYDSSSSSSDDENNKKQDDNYEMDFIPKSKLIIYTIYRKMNLSALINIYIYIPIF